MKTRALVWLFAGAMVAAGCSKDSSGPSEQGPPTTPPPGTTNVQVSLGASTFSPASVQIPVGGSVTWRNATATAHTITPDAAEQPGSWGSVSVPGQTAFTFTHTFNTAGTFDYRCNLHAGMTGTVRVQ